MTTSPKNWETIKELFDAALEEDPAQRSSFLSARCNDPEVRNEVQRLLAEHEKASAFWSVPALDNVRKEAAEPCPARLSEGEVLAGRFRIVRFIAAGGMGEVYEAEDEELRERVAIKIIRPEVLGHVNSVARFRREVHLARQVTHPNVCRVFDLFRHNSSTGQPQEIVFISMELLQGPHMAERMRETGEMNTASALPLIRQMASALAAAHEAGIVHRDFKPQNVVLVSVPGKDGQRAVVTDFGLALQPESVGEMSFSTGSGLLGTPVYMSPEQMEGRPATPASDIYALGLVIYEMITGNRPFQGDTPMSAALKRLSEPPTPPHKFKPTINPVWEDVILRCLDRDPAKRFATAEEVSKALAGEDTTQSNIRATRSGLDRRVVLAACAGVVAVVLGVGYAVRYWHRNEANINPKIAVRHSIAVLGFKNLSGRPDEGWLSTALSEMLTTELSAGERLRTVPGESVAQMKLALALADADGYGKDTLSRIQKGVDADQVVVGSYLALGKDTGGKVHLDLKLQDVSSGETTAALVEDGSEDQLPTLVSHVGAALLQKLGVAGLSPAQSTELTASISHIPEANRYYAEGLAKLRSFDPQASKILFEKSLAADPDFALAHSALSLAWDHLGYHQKSKEEASKAVALSENLSREEKLSITARYQEAADDWGKAVDTHRALFSFFPDNIDYGLNLARAQTRASKGRDALATIAALRQLPKSSANDARVDGSEAETDFSLGELKSSQELADRAVRQAEANGQRLLEARFLRVEGRAYQRLGQQKEARAAWEKALEIDREFGDKGEVARTLTAIGIQLDETGDLPGSKSTYEQALPIFRDIGDTEGIASTLIDLGNVVSDQGDPQTAQKLYEEALPLCRQVEQKVCESSALTDIANRMMEQGNLTNAATIYRELENKFGGSTPAENSGDLLYEMGYLNQANDKLREALKIATEHNERGDIAFSAYELGRVAVAQDKLVDARHFYEQAESVFKQMEDPDDVGNVHLALAELEIEEGNVPLAESTARQVIEYFKTENNSSAQATAQAVLAEILVQKGDATAALTELAPQFKRPNPNRMTSAQIAPVIARALAGAKNYLEAVRGLKTSLAEAVRMKCVTCEFDQRLAMGQIELEYGNAATGRTLLVALEKDAKTRGHLFVARKASSLRNHHAA